MKVFACLLPFLALVLLSETGPARAEGVMPVARIGKANVVRLEVAHSQEEITRGLMYRTSLPDDAGMVFIFHPAQSVQFWMYHTLIPLDMLFIRDGKIIKIATNVPPCRSENPGDCARYPEAPALVSEVVEVNGGWCRKHGVVEGDPVKFELP